MTLGFNRGNRKVIRAPRKPIAEKDVETRFNELNKAFLKIFQNERESLSFEQLYVYGRELVRDLGQKDETYNNVELFLEKECDKCRETIQKVQPDSFLKIVAETFWNYRQSSKTIADILMFLDFNRPKSKPRIFRKALDMFFDKVVVLVKDRITEHLLKEILDEREGNKINRTLLHHCTTMLHDTLCYEEIFEQYLLVSTTEYYRNQSEELATSCDVPTYLERVYERVQEEVDRVESYLVQTTGPKIDSILREEMVTKRMEFLLEDPNTGFTSLLRDDRIQDLGRMYFLFNFSIDHLGKMVERFQSYIFEFGKKYVLNEDNLKDSVKFIDGILLMKKKYDIILHESFQTRDIFVEALDVGFQQFSDGNLQKRVAECLSLYLDHSMKTNPDVEDPEFEGSLDRALSVFRYLKDKKVFENYYKIHLSKRLLAAKSNRSKIAERMFLKKLKAQTKKAFVAKIDGMFNDLDFSVKKMELFSKHETYPEVLKTTDMTFHVNVLTRSFWPTYTLSKTILPSEMQELCQAFTKFHKDIHSLRALSWQKNLGDGLVLARYPLSKVRLIATTYQMVLLLLFNTSNSLKYTEICDKVDIPEKDLQRNLLLLCLGEKLLKKSPKSGPIQPEDTFTWNGHFQSKKDTIHISNSVVQQVKPQKTEVTSSSNPLEFAIIQYMKSHQTSEFKDAAKHVMKETKAKPMAIKKEIEALISKGLIERDPDNIKILKYKQ